VPTVLVIGSHYREDMPEFLRLFAAVAVLAGLDLAGTLCLKEAALRKSPILGMLGVTLFVVLALTLYVILETSELTIVTLGWIVILQVAVVAVDVLRYEVVLTRLQAAAITVAVLALVVAAVAPAGERTKATKPLTTPAAKDTPIVLIPEQAFANVEVALFRLATRQSTARPSVPTQRRALPGREVPDRETHRSSGDPQPR
jgi:hypothetical protein